jgi:hypothetical protein
MTDARLSYAQNCTLAAAAHRLPPSCRETFRKHCHDVLRPLAAPSDADLARAISFARAKLGLVERFGIA